jgi:hypothetical protein
MREGKLWTSDHGKIVIDEDAIVIYDFHDNEIVYWDHQEWKDDAETAQCILNALRIAVSDGVGAVAAMMKDYEVSKG